MNKLFYLDNYRNILPSSPAKLPFQFSSLEEVESRIASIYNVIVENRGHQMCWDNDTQQHISDVSQWIFTSPQRGLLLFGSVGNGKTTMLKAINWLFRGGAVVLSAKAIYEYYKENERLQNNFGSKILLIDDLGTEPERCLIYGEDHHPLSDMLMRRYENNATTIIATNLSGDDIRLRYGDRVYDRILEMFFSILYTSPSYRAKI